MMRLLLKQKCTLRYEVLMLHEDLEYLAEVKCKWHICYCSTDYDAKRNSKSTVTKDHVFETVLQETQTVRCSNIASLALLLYTA